MLAVTHLGDARSDIVSALAYLPGVTKVKANSWLNDFEGNIRAQAKVGAKSAVMPYIIGLGVLSTLGIGLSVYSVLRR